MLMKPGQRKAWPGLCVIIVSLLFVKAGQKEVSLEKKYKRYELLRKYFKICNSMVDR
ncbi:hypothetical protein SAMN05216283_11853 [Sunxiuqinia elliptica]|uniref:Uncharacterized protein n=1 Tax=Sunxiuqinia elliptica TaxID=655355 RepID=A0A1I2M486_9BACT|nr:hypothetical protein SAMN05216283_11853 [Sunxiuqinia elliptica]